MVKIVRSAAPNGFRFPDAVKFRVDELRAAQGLAPEDFERGWESGIRHDPFVVQAFEELGPGFITSVWGYPKWEFVVEEIDDIYAEVYIMREEDVGESLHYHIGDVAIAMVPDVHTAQSMSPQDALLLVQRLAALVEEYSVELLGDDEDEGY